MQRRAIVVDVLEHVPQENRRERAGRLAERLPAYRHARIRRERALRMRDRRIGEVDGNARPTFAREMRAGVALAAADLEERRREAVLLDEAIEAVDHVLLQRQEVGHAG